jgi:hypothetical protein
MTKVQYISTKYAKTDWANDWPNDLPQLKKKGNGRIRSFLCGVAVGVVILAGYNKLKYTPVEPTPMTEAQRAAIAFEYLTNGLEGLDTSKPVIKPTRKPTGGN